MSYFLNTTIIKTIIKCVMYVIDFCFHIIIKIKLVIIYQGASNAQISMSAMGNIA